MDKIKHKINAIFCKDNEKRLEQIITANGDTKKLAEIPPSFIVLDLTWRCNYSCNLCIDGEAVNKKKVDLPIKIIEDIFDYSKNNKVRGIMSMGGEVFLYKEGIRKVLEKSVEYQIPIKTVSNGSCLNLYLEQIKEVYKIPGSMLRISINSTKKNYKKYTKSNVGLEKILDYIEKITQAGVPISVSTVIFPEELKKYNLIPNLIDLNEIIRYCEDAGVNKHILIPARNPSNSGRYHLNTQEKDLLKEIKQKNQEGHYKLDLGIDEFSGRIFYDQNLRFKPCPSGFLFTLIGSDGRIFKCTDHRGNNDMVLGKIEKSGDFERFWHSEERVKKQLEMDCNNISCIRYEINSLLDCCCQLYKERGLYLPEYMHLIKDATSIFI